MPDSVRWTAICPSHPGGGSLSPGTGDTHEVMAAEMRCVYCGVRIDPYPCHGCGRFLKPSEMHEGARCEECS